MRNILISTLIAGFICLMASALFADVETNIGINKRIIFRDRVSKSSPGILVYKNLGIRFNVGDRGRGVTEVMVFPPKQKPIYTPRTIGEDEVVPGLGAFGLTLGSSDKEVEQVLSQIRPKLDRSEASGRYIEMADGRKITMSFPNGKLSAIVISGHFTTPEGINEASAVRDIINAYGKPDSYWQIVSTYQPAHKGFSLLIYSVFGIICGLFMLELHRKYPEGGKILYAIVGGAFLNAAASLMALAVDVPQSMHGPLQSYTLIIITAVMAAVSGAAALTTYERLRLKSRWFIALISMLLAGSIATIIVTVVLSIFKLETPDLVYTLTLNGLLYIFAFLVSWPIKKSPERETPKPSRL